MSSLEVDRSNRVVRRRSLLAFVAVVCVAGCATKVVGFSQPHVDEQELMSRWNVVADGLMVQGFNFRWDTFDTFPHPTFKGGGSTEAYQAFAAVLIAFFERDDNFDFLARNKAFTFPLSSFGLMTTFEDLTTMLLTGDWIGLSPATRYKLDGFATRIANAR